MKKEDIALYYTPQLLMREGFIYPNIHAVNVWHFYL